MAVIAFEAHQAGAALFDEVGGDFKIAQGDIRLHMTAEDFLEKIIFARTRSEAAILGIAETLQVDVFDIGVSGKSRTSINACLSAATKLSIVDPS